MAKVEQRDRDAASRYLQKGFMVTQNMERPDHPPTARDLEQAIADARAQGRTEERARVVEWIDSELERLGAVPQPTADVRLMSARLTVTKDAIEAGEHEE